MKRPIKPFKPSKNSYPPSTRLYVDKILARDYNTNKLVLLDNEDKLWESCDTVHDLDYKTVLEIRKLVPDHVDNFEIVQENDYGNITISYNLEKDKATIDKELAAFNNRFTKYEKDLKKWKADMVKYEEFQKYLKIQRLEKELKKLRK